MIFFLNMYNNKLAAGTDKNYKGNLILTISVFAREENNTIYGKLLSLLNLWRTRIAA